MTEIWEALTFKRMISPAVVQFLFWGGIGGALYGTWVLIRLEHWAWPLALVFGMLVVRVIFERLILAFRTYDRLGEIRDALARLEGGDR